MQTSSGKRHTENFVGSAWRQIRLRSDFTQVEDILWSWGQNQEEKSNRDYSKSGKSSFWWNGHNSQKQTAPYERCPLLSAGTTSLGAIHSKARSQRTPSDAHWAWAAKERTCCGRNFPAICTSHWRHGTSAKVEKLTYIRSFQILVNLCLEETWCSLWCVQREFS